MVFLYIKNGKRMLPTSKSHPWKKISSSPMGGETPVASMLWWEGPEANDRINWERDVSWRMKGKWLPIIRPGGRRAFNDLSTLFLKGSKEVLFWLFVVLVLLLFVVVVVVCCLLFVVCCLLFVVCCLLFVVCCLLFVVCCLLFVVCCLLFVVGCWLLVVCCLLFVVCCVCCLLFLLFVVFVVCCFCCLLFLLFVVFVVFVVCCFVVCCVFCLLCLLFVVCCLLFVVCCLLFVVVVVVAVKSFRVNWDAKKWTRCVDTFCPVSRSPEPAFEVHEKKVRFAEGLFW